MTRSLNLPFDLWALEVFLNVCETGSMSDAGRRLGITQPAISSVISQMEEKLGVTLIDRKLRPLRLTAAGGTLQRQAARLLSEARRVGPMVRQSGAAIAPCIRVGLVDSLASTVGPSLVQHLQGAANEVVITTGMTAGHVGAFLERNLDFIITADDMDGFDGLDRFPLFREPYVLLLPPAFHYAGPIHLSMLAGRLPLIRYGTATNLGATIERHLRRCGVDAPRSLEFDSSEMVVAMVRAGLGWSIGTPLCVLDAHVEKDAIRIERIINPGLFRNLTLVARHGELGSLALRAANLACQLLREKVLPQLRGFVPAIEKDLRIGSGQSANLPAHSSISPTGPALA